MFCKKCGHKLADNVVFCPICGTKTRQDNSKSISAVSENWISKPSFSSKQVSRAVADGAKPPVKKEPASQSEISKDIFQADKWYCRSYDDPYIRILIDKVKPKPKPQPQDSVGSQNMTVKTGTNLPVKKENDKKIIAIIAAVIGIILLLLIIAGAEEWDEEAAAKSYSVSAESESYTTLNQDIYFSDSLAFPE